MCLMNSCHNDCSCSWTSCNLASFDVHIHSLSLRLQSVWVSVWVSVCSYVCRCLCCSAADNTVTGGLWSCRFNPARCICRRTNRNIPLGLLHVTRWRRHRSPGRSSLHHRRLSRTKRQWRRRRGNCQNGLRLATPQPGLLDDIALLVPPPCAEWAGHRVRACPAGNRRVMWTCLAWLRLVSRDLKS